MIGITNWKLLQKNILKWTFSSCVLNVCNVYKVARAVRFQKLDRYESINCCKSTVKDLAG